MADLIERDRPSFEEAAGWIRRAALSGEVVVEASYRVRVYRVGGDLVFRVIDTGGEIPPSYYGPLAGLGFDSEILGVLAEASNRCVEQAKARAFNKVLGKIRANWGSE